MNLFSCKKKGGSEFISLQKDRRFLPVYTLLKFAGQAFHSFEVRSRVLGPFGAASKGPVQVQ